MIFGCYCLDVYCDVRGCHNYAATSQRSDQFTGTSEAAAMRAARKAGWTVDRERRVARCPKHKGRHIPKEST